MFHYGGCEDYYNEPHFLEACFLCRKPLASNSDIFMYRLANFSCNIKLIFNTQMWILFNNTLLYLKVIVFTILWCVRFWWVYWVVVKFCRGNTPFCSKECRQEQIEIDESKEKSLKLSSSSSSASSSSSTRAIRKSDPNKNSTPNKAVRTGTVAVA